MLVAQQYTCVMVCGCGGGDVGGVVEMWVGRWRCGWGGGDVGGVVEMCVRWWRRWCVQYVLSHIAQVHPKTKTAEQDELSSLLQVPIVVGV